MKCGCIIVTKVRVSSAKCPVGKWESLDNQEQT